MHYAHLALPATGGGAFLLGGIAGVNPVISVIVAVMLTLTIVGIVKLLRGEIVLSSR